MVYRLLSIIQRMWHMRTSDARSERVLWWSGAAVLIGALLFHSSFEEYFVVTWSIANIGLSFASLGWVCFHPRSLGKSSDSALTWSRWLTLAAAIELFVLSQSSPSRSENPPGFVLLMILASVPFLLVGFLIFSMFGACLGAFIRRKSYTCERVAMASVSGWWISAGLITAVRLTMPRDGIRAEIVSMLAMGMPVFTLIVASLIRRYSSPSSDAPFKLADTLLRPLVIRRSIRGKLRVFDFRGVAIGLITASATLLVAPEVVQPIQQSALMSLFRFRTQIMNSLSTQRKPSTRVVFETLDADAKAVAVTTSSEAAVQAKLIRRLTKAGVSVIVLPAPTIDVITASNGETTSSAVEATVRDLPTLVDAVKTSGRVIVVASRQQRASKRLSKLFAAAKSVADFGVDRYGAVQLPTVPMHWDADPPAPLIALAMEHNRDFGISFGNGEQSDAIVAGIHIPTAIQGRAVFDLRSAPSIDLHRDPIPKLTAGTLLGSKTLSLAEFNNGSSSLNLDSFLAHRVVVLSPLVQEDIDTPSGAMPRYELLAEVTSSLINDSAIRPGNHRQAIIWTIVLGLLIGALCAGKDPLQASWRVASLMLLNVLYCLFTYLVQDIWTDPVVPLVTSTVAFLLVTQLTFSLERDERERNRQLFSRFVAPEFVDELLQSGARKLALGGEKRTVCVLFADVRNFTGFAESHRPEEVIEVMNIYLTAMTDALDAHGGLLDKYTGDGLMAFFEIKDDYNSELVRSVQGAIAMRDAALEVSMRMEQSGRKPLDVGIGMHCGEAIVGLVGNAERQINYTALGITVVVSARLQTLAEGGDIVVSDVIHDVVGSQFWFEPMPPVFVKGISTEMHPYRVERAIQAAQ